MDWNYQMNDIAECGRHGTFVSWFEKLALKLTKELISEAEAKENEKKMKFQIKVEMMMKMVKKEEKKKKT